MSEPEPGPPGNPLGELVKAREILGVGELTRRIRATLEGAFGALWLTGEVSNLRAPASGHIYLTLKDSEAQVRAVIWASTARYLGERPRDGDQILCRGRLTVYEPRGEYQVVIDYLEAAGVGALYRRIEATRQRLLAEGLLDKARKRPLPLLPRRVAVVTSASGAALRDILTVLERRAPGLSVLVVPAQVQGDAAPRELVRALGAAGSVPDIDAVILARGGGSLEDLMAFNDEAVARAVAACPVPVVAGVGHETDTTIADLAADLRAPTPSAAAELVSAAWGDLPRRTREGSLRLNRAMERRLTALRLHARAARAGLIDPRDRLRHTGQRVDDLHGQLARLLRATLARDAHRRQAAAVRLAAVAPGARIPGLAERTHALRSRLRQAARLQLRHAAARLAEDAGKLSELSPLGVLGRGYAIARRGDAILRGPEQAPPGTEIGVQLHGGSLTCRVLSAQPARGSGN